MHEERAPAAADVEQPLAGRDAQLAADQLELALLRALERVPLALEVGTGVDEARSEQHLVEACSRRRSGGAPTRDRGAANGADRPARPRISGIGGRRRARGPATRRAAAASRARPMRPSESSPTRRRRPSTRSRSPSTSSAPDTHARPSPSWFGARRKCAIARSSRMSDDRCIGLARDDGAVIPEAHRHGQLLERAGESLHAVDARGHGRSRGRRATFWPIVRRCAVDDAARSFAVHPAASLPRPNGGWARATAERR